MSDKKIINGVELVYVQSFLTHSAAFNFAKKNYINCGLSAQIIKNRGANILYNVYAEFKDI